MTPHAQHGPLMTAAQIQGMAGKADGHTARLLAGLSVAVLLMMLVREGRDMLQGDHHKQTWRERETERRSEAEHRGR